MGRTYRGNRPGERTFERRIQQPETITFEWARQITAANVDYLLNDLIEQGLVNMFDKGAFRTQFELAILRAVDRYRPERGAAATTYLAETLHNEYLKIINAARRYARHVVLVPIGDVYDPVEGGVETCSDAMFSDGCRSVRQLEMKIDIDTIRQILRRVPGRGRSLVRFFDLLVMGHTCHELALRAELPEQYVILKYLHPVRTICRRCGYGPASEGR